MSTADCAASEQTAAKLLHPKTGRRSAVEKLPSLKMILRDNADSQSGHSFATRVGQDPKHCLAFPKR
eukprot:12914184-Prorocentrum_lima.AAC.1